MILGKTARVGRNVEDKGKIYREKAQKYFQVQRSRNSQIARVPRVPVPTDCFDVLINTGSLHLKESWLTRQYHHAIGKSQEQEGQWQGIR